MKRFAVCCVGVAWIAMFTGFCSAQQSVSDESMQASSQDSSQDSMQASSEDSLQTSSQESSAATSEESSAASTDQSSANTTDQSFQYSTDETTVGSTEATTQGSTDGSDQSGNASIVTAVVAGAVIGIGLTVGGIIYLVEITGARRESALAFQDEIYAAAGVEYQRVLTLFELPEVDLIRANDVVVSAGYTIGSDREAADYLAALVLEVSGSLPTINGETVSTPGRKLEAVPTG